MPGIGRDLLVGDPAAVEAERDPGGQVDAGDGFGGEVLGGEEDQVAWLPPRVLTHVSRRAIARAQPGPARSAPNTSFYLFPPAGGSPGGRLIRLRRSSTAEAGRCHSLARPPPGLRPRGRPPGQPGVVELREIGR